MDNLTVVIPFYNGHKTIARLIDSLPGDLPVLIVDDVSAEPYQSNLPHVKVIRLAEKGYFAGAVNAGLAACQTDVLILNQDVWLEGTAWQELIANNRERYALIGDGVFSHPAWPRGYVQGTFMFMIRRAVETVGLLNAPDYPLWGGTCEYQIRLCRAGMQALPVSPVPGLHHARKDNEAYGSSIQQLLKDEPHRKGLFIRTPPEVSVVVSCYNYGRYLPDLVHSLIGGETSLGTFTQQSFASFEVVIVDDASTDDSWTFCQQVSDPWKGVRSVRLPANGGTAAANNAGIRAAHGKYIAIMNADDMMESGRLERLYRAQLQNPHSFIYDGIMAFADGQRRPDRAFRVSEYDFEKLLYKNHVHAGIMFPKTAWQEVGGYPEAFRDGREDWAINVALGIRGWCGVYLHERGYLYRRERQNRTLTNTSPKHHQTFLQRLIATFPAVYAGERPSMCCGNGPGSAQAMNNPSSNQNLRQVVPGGAGTILLQYVGRSYGTQSFYGLVTGARYEAGLTKAVIPVDLRDAETGQVNRPGLLEIREDGKNVFRRYTPPAAAPTPALETTLTLTPTPGTETAFSPSPPAKLAVPDQGVSLPVVSEIPDVNILTAKEILALDLVPAQAVAMLAVEQDGKQRKTVLAFLESMA